MKESRELELLPEGLRISPEYYVKGNGVCFTYDLTDEERKEFEKVLGEGGIKLIISYPLNNPATFDVPVEEGIDDYFLNSLIEFICDKYKQVYEEEEEGLKGEDLMIPGMFNRKETNGKYGIWGHELGDLSICSITLNLDTKEIILGVDS